MLKSILFNALYQIKFFRIINYNFNPYLKQLKNLKKLKLKNDSIFIDIGGNRGFVSGFIKDYFNCNIDIYEPHPACYQILKDKFYKSRNIKIFNLAVSNKHKKMKLYLKFNSKNEFDIRLAASSSLEKNKSNISKKNFLYVQTIDIKKIINNYSFIDVLKVDVEQHEYKILPCIYSNLHKIGIVIIELHDDKKNIEISKLYNFWKQKLEKENLWNTKFFDWI